MLRIHHFLFRNIHSASQLSIYGAVSDWSGQLGQSPNETEPISEKFMTSEESVNNTENAEECEFTGKALQ